MPIRAIAAPIADNRDEVVANEFANSMLQRLSDADINALHDMIDTQRTHFISSEISLYDDQSATIKSAVKTRM